MFVSNVDEAKELATKFSNKGIKAKALSSQDSEQIRQTTIAQLESGELEIIVTVDIFNEGVDIPCINQIILLRPTQSAIVYIQQLGRGLRKYQDKKFVVILDFIANYTNNFLIAVALSGDNSYDKDELKSLSYHQIITWLVKVPSLLVILPKRLFIRIFKNKFLTAKNIKRDYTQLKKSLVESQI